MRALSISAHWNYVKRNKRNRERMSSALEEFESSIISEAALSTEAFEFCDSEEDLELAKALEEYESGEEETEVGFGVLGWGEPFAVHAKGCALDARAREVWNENRLD